MKWLLNPQIVDEIFGEAEQRFFLRVLRYVMEFSRGMNLPIGMLIVHIPEAFSLNDKTKPLPRDRMVVETARLLGKSIRLSDVVGALGEDSFYVFLPKCDGTGIKHVMDRVNRNLRELKSKLNVASEFKLKFRQFIWTPQNPDTVDDLVKKGLELLEEARSDAKTCPNHSNKNYRNDNFVIC